MKILALLLFVSFAAHAEDAKLEVMSPEVKADQTMVLEQVFNGFGCTGKNISPELSWTKGPEGTQSYAVTMYDPDAPTGSGWWHWTAFNIPADVTKLGKDAGGKGKKPKGMKQGRTDFGKSGYGGPCPPEGSGPHHYIFTVYALKLPALPLDSNSSGAMVGFYANGNSLAKGTLTAVYSR